MPPQSSLGWVSKHKRIGKSRSRVAKCQTKANAVSVEQTPYTHWVDASFPKRWETVDARRGYVGFPAKKTKPAGKKRRPKQVDRAKQSRKKRQQIRKGVSKKTYGIGNGSAGRVAVSQTAAEQSAPRHECWPCKTTGHSMKRNGVCSWKRKGKKSPKKNKTKAQLENQVKSQEKRIQKLQMEVNRFILRQKIARERTKRMNELACAVQECEKGMAVSVPLRENLWLADSGASCHMGPDDDGMFDCKIINEPVAVGTGHTCNAVKIGKKRVTMLQSDGSTLDTVLPVYKHVPGLTVNLFSVMSALENGWKLSNRGLYLVLRKGKHEIVFDRLIKTQDGKLCGVEILTRHAEMANPTAGIVGKTWDINRMHKVFNHGSEEALRRTAKAYGWKVTGKFETCEHCQTGNIKQSAMPKETYTRHEKPGGRLYLDLSWVEKKCLGGVKIWLTVVDDKTDRSWVEWFSMKSDMIPRVLKLMRKLQAAGHKVERIRCDNAGENKKLQQKCEETTDLCGIKFEFTASRTPQQNGRCERKIALLTARSRAMLNAAHLEGKLRSYVASEAITTANDIENILLSRQQEDPAYRAFYQEDLAKMEYLRQFGEIAVIKFGKTIKGKVENRGIHVMYLGRERDHSPDCHRFLNLATWKPVGSRDAIWLNKTWGEWKGTARKEISREMVGLLPDQGIKTEPDDMISAEGSYADPDSDDDEAHHNRRPQGRTTDEVAEESGRNQARRRSERALGETGSGQVRTRSAIRRTGEELMTFPEGGVLRRPRTRSPRRAQTNQGPEESLPRSNSSVEQDVSDGPQTVGSPVVAQRMLERLAQVDGTIAGSIADRVRATADDLEGRTNHQSGREERKEAEEVSSLPSDQAALAADAFCMIDRFGAEFDEDVLPEMVMLAKDQVLTEDEYEKMNPARYKDIFDKPDSFDQAWNHPEPFQRKKWREAINKEFSKMEERQVWKKVKRSTVPGNRRCVKHKWVFEVKRDGRFRARLVACGYSQIPGVDFSENYSPVIHDATYRLLLLVQMKKGLSSRIIDVETAFLHGDLEEEIYMNCPPGFTEVLGENVFDNCLLLEKSIYGLVQAARQFFKKLVMKLEDIGFKQSEFDPCLMVKKNETEECYVAIYVDGCYCVGTKKDLEDLTKRLQVETDRVEPFKIKIEDGTNDYLSCEVIFNEEKTKGWLGQPHLVKKLYSTFWEDVKNMQVYKTPGTPGMSIIRAKSDEEKVKSEMQAKYRSGVGMLLYLVKHSRPDIANQVRELSKALDGPTEACLKEMYRVIKFVLDTKDVGLKMFPDEIGEDYKWKIQVFTDSDWAGDRDTRLSVSGFVLYVLGVPILWRSKGQKSVALSSSEAEYISLSEAAKEVKFVSQLLDSMYLKVEKPIKVRVDNVGAIFMTKNNTTTSKTRRVDNRYNYDREMVTDGFVEIIFVKTAENKSDGFTNNLSSELYQKHSQKQVVSKSEILQETEK